jgi:hypothetical protein
VSDYDESFARAQRAYDMQSDERDIDEEEEERYREGQAERQLDDMQADQAERAFAAIRKAQ